VESVKAATEKKKNRNAEKKDKKSRDKQRSEAKNSFLAEHDLSSDEYIRMNNLPSETLAIHSPESGNTSIF